MGTITKKVYKVFIIVFIGDTANGYYRHIIYIYTYIPYATNLILYSIY